VLPSYSCRHVATLEKRPGARLEARRCFQTTGHGKGQRGLEGEAAVAVARLWLALLSWARVGGRILVYMVVCDIRTQIISPPICHLAQAQPDHRPNGHGMFDKVSRFIGLTGELAWHETSGPLAVWKNISLLEERL
jgi:hypothetical protein